VAVVYIPLNDRGQRIGQHHPRATISDADVELIRVMHEEQGRSYGWIAYKVGRPVCTIAKICRYERRVQRPERWKRLVIAV
jgi:hypothetical protein